MHVPQRNPEDGAPGVLIDTAASGTKALVSLGELTVQDLTVVGALTLTLACGGSKNYRHCLEVWLRQDSSGHSVTLPSNVTWVNGSVPTVSTTPNAVTVVQFTTTDGGGSWAGNQLGTGSGSGGGFSNPMSTAGDIITGGSSGTPQRLAAGSNNQVLTVVSGAPAWAAPAANPAFSTTVTKNSSWTFTTGNMNGLVRHTDGNPYSWTIDTFANSGIGSCVINGTCEAVGGLTIVAAAGVTLKRLDSVSGTGNRTIAGYSMFTLINLDGGDTWGIEGTGVS
jgi:hypothetical protein